MYGGTEKKYWYTLGICGSWFLNYSKYYKTGFNKFKLKSKSKSIPLNHH